MKQPIQMDIVNWKNYAKSLLKKSFIDQSENIRTQVLICTHTHKQKTDF